MSRALNRTITARAAANLPSVAGQERQPRVRGKLGWWNGARVAHQRPHLRDLQQCTGKSRGAYAISRRSLTVRRTIGRWKWHAVRRYTPNLSGGPLEEALDDLGTRASLGADHHVDVSPVAEAMHLALFVTSQHLLGHDHLFATGGLGRQGQKAFMSLLPATSLLTCHRR